MSKTATLIKDIGRNGVGADWRLYHLDPPIEVARYDSDAEAAARVLRDAADEFDLFDNDNDNAFVMAWLRERADRREAPALHEYVIVSANDVTYSGPETYIFAASEAGEIVDWCELSGSFKGALDHEEALRGAGYEVAR